MSDTQRLGARRVLRIEDIKVLRVIDSKLKVVQTWDCGGARVALPLHFDSPGQVVDGELVTDRYYLSIFSDELVYLHEAVPVT